jgi:3-oxoacyl-[acyl-carrier protein] reductase
MDLGIKNKVAVVTGASSGIGKSVAQRLAQEGCRVVLYARSPDKLKIAADDIRQQFGAEVLGVVGDLTSGEDTDRLAWEVKKAFGGADILVLNTGRPPLGMREALDETDDARWEEAYRAMLWSGVLVLRKIMPMLVERGWGRVIGLTTASVKQPMKHHALSTVYRAGLAGLLKHLANENAARGVTVNMVCPASVATDSFRAYWGQYGIEERLKQVPVGRFGHPDELAATVAFLASDLAGFITGESVHVDGGMIMALN